MAGGEGGGGGNVNSYGSGDRSVSLSLQTSYCCTNKNTEISEKFWHELSDYLVSLHHKAPETWGKTANAFHFFSFHPCLQCEIRHVILNLNTNTAANSYTTLQINRLLLADVLFWDKIGF